MKNKNSTEVYTELNLSYRDLLDIFSRVYAVLNDEQYLYIPDFDSLTDESIILRRGDPIDNWKNNSGKIFSTQNAILIETDEGSILGLQLVEYPYNFRNNKYYTFFTLLIKVKNILSNSTNLNR